MSNDAPITLQLQFDMAQVSTVLQYRLTQVPRAETGCNAGTYGLQNGDQIWVEVTVLVDHPTVSEGSVELNDLTLVCLPAAGAQQTELSPYSKDSATITLSDWGDPIVLPGPSEGIAAYVYTAVDPLTVVATSGQWKLAGYLSASITSLTGDFPGSEAYAHVYTFDPEVIVGSGT